MPRNNWGPTGKRRAKHLVEALLDYAKYYPFNKLSIANLELRWEQEANLSSNSAKLIVQTKLKSLEELTKRNGHQLEKMQLIEVLKSLKDLQILTDNRVKKQGKEDWLFTLNLWSRDKYPNLEQLELKWEKYKLSKSKINCYQDWADAPVKQNFYGREVELAELKQWIIDEQCSVVVIVGMGGVGKTSLSVKLGTGGIGKTDLSLKLARDIQDEFDYILWRSLRNAPPIECLLLNVIKFLSNQQEIKENTVDEQSLKLLDCLRSNRCLLILDNVETILKTGQNSPHYRTGYEGYGKLFEMIAQSEHQSCLLLTTREKPPRLVTLAGQNKPVRFLELQGLDYLNGLKILKDIGNFLGTDDEWQRLIEFYDGNPLALELASHHIKDSFGSDISVFLKEGKPVFNNLCELLNWHFKRLVEREREILYWLAINREPVSRSQLKQDIVSLRNKDNLASTLESLQGKIPLQKNEDQQLFTLQPVLMEFITEKLNEEIFKEICQKKRNWQHFNNYALIKAQAKDYLKSTQIRLIVRPLLQELIEKFQGQKNLENRLKEILKISQNQMSLQPGYLGGNIVNFLAQLKTDLRYLDLSNLTLWQADLQEIQLMGVNLTNSDLSQSTFSQIFSNILTVEISYDENFLAAGDANGEIHLWNLKDGQQIFSLKGHRNYVNKIKFTANSSQLVSCSSDYTIKLWDLTTGRCVKTLQGHSNRVSDIALSPSEQILVSGSGDGMVRVWDLKQKTTIKIIHLESGVREIVFYPDDENILIIAHEDGTIKLWHLIEDKCLMTILAHDGPIFSLALNKNTQILVSGSGDATIKFWDLHTGQCLQVLSGHTGGILDLAFSSDYQILASASEDKTIKLWSIDGLENFQSLIGHTGKVQSIVFTPDNQMIISGSNDRTVKRWEIKGGYCSLSLSGYTNWHTSIAFSPDGKILASGANDGRLRLWSVSTGQCLKILMGHDSQVEAMVFSPNGQRLASGDANGRIKLWNLKTYDCLQTLSGSPDGHTNTVWMTEFSPNNQFLVSGSSDGTAKIWEVRSGECLHSFSHSSGVWSVAISADGQTLATSCHDGTVSFWNLNLGKKLKTLKVHQGQVFKIAFSRDGKILMTGSNDSTVKLLDVATGKCVKSIEGFNDEILAFAENNGQILVTDSSLNSYEVKIRDLVTGKWLNTLTGHDQGIWSVTLSQDGEKGATTSHDETIRIWELKTGNCLQVLKVEALYENMNITNIKGLTDAEKANLKALGAFEVTH